MRFVHDLRHLDFGACLASVPCPVVGVVFTDMLVEARLGTKALATMPTHFS